ncbi:NmrA/HSCARG family protein [Mucilaginibacter lutimaris]|uniref:NmrA/HSCARG family protein n=1 Tax=Mucilaginibacter lutimaris TaxID=931629 RepID=A0ABW2ZEF0_9SPHI
MRCPKIVVCGATGNQGGAVAAALLKSGSWSVTALTRDPGSAAAKALADLGAEVLKADLLNMRSLREAFRGAQGVFCVTQPWSSDKGRFDPGMEIRQAKNIIWACRETAVPHVICSSILNITESISGVPYVDSKLIIEDLFTRNLSGCIIVRPALYMENIGTPLMSISDNKIKGRFAGDSFIPYVALSDIGASVAEIFSSPDEFADTKIILAGDLVSGNELAKWASEVSEGRVFRYEPANELLLRLFRPRFYHMRRFFTKQGLLLHRDTSPPGAYHMLPADPLTMAEYLSTKFGNSKRSPFVHIR